MTVAASAGRPRDAARPWDAAWPSHVPRSIDYPGVPAWWFLERAATRAPDRTAVIDLDPATLTEHRSVTYGALFRAARGVASGLAARGIAPGDRIGLALQNSAALVIAYYGAWLAGAVAVPANPAARRTEIEEHLKDASVRLLVAPRGDVTEDAATRLGVPLVDLDSLAAMERLAPIALGVSGPDLAVLLYTGGTTGTPKGAMLTHANLVANTIQFATWYAFEPGAETCVAAIPMFHSGGMSGVMNVPISAGATLLAFPRFSAAGVARAVSRYRATRLFGVPTMFIALLEDDDGRRADYGTLRACRTNAAPLPPTVKTAFDTLVGREVLVEGYGLTETSPLTHANPVGRARPGSIGIPLSDTDARIVDLDTGAEVAPGQSGELLIRGPQVMRAYWNRPDETAVALRDGWLHTGDVATMDADGYFAIVDRKKDMINTAGFKVWPREVEETLYAHPAVKIAVVIGAPDGYRGEVVKAFVVLKDPTVGAVRAEDLIDFCRDRLSGYKVPRQLEIRRELPLTATGKLVRRALREA